MAVRDEITLVDQAQKHVNRLRLVSTVGVMPAYMGTLTKYDAWMLAIFSSTMSDVSNWVVSDLLVWAEDKLAQERAEQDDGWYAERDKRWTDLLAACGREYTPGVRRRMAATARAWPWERRRHTEVVKYRHHRLLAGYTPEEQEEWMDLVEAGRWPSTRLENELKWALETGVRPPDARVRVMMPSAEGVEEFLDSVGVHLERKAAHHAVLHIAPNLVHIGVGDEGLRFTLERGAGDERAGG